MLGGGVEKSSTLAFSSVCSIFYGVFSTLHSSYGNHATLIHAERPLGFTSNKPVSFVLCTLAVELFILILAFELPF